MPTPKLSFLNLEIIQANVKVEHISTKKLDSVLSSQKDKTSLGYIGEGSSNGQPIKGDEVCVGKECREVQGRESQG